MVLFTAHDARARLQDLSLERIAAADAGLTGNAAYMADLDADIETAREAYVGLAVTEIASLRAEISGKTRG
jgi:hypothetical protein